MSVAESATDKCGGFAGVRLLPARPRDTRAAQFARQSVPKVLFWVAMSLWLALASGLPLTAVGLGWVLLQACFVLIIAILEWAGIRSLGPDQLGPTAPPSGRASPSAPAHHPREAARS